MLPIAGAIFWATSPLLSVLHGKLAPSGSAGYCLPFPGVVACHSRCSLPAQAPMKSIDTAAPDGLGLVPATGDSRKRSSATVRCANGRRRASCAIGATVAGAALR